MMTGTSFSTGDTVQLNSGGFAMTVEDLTDGRAKCVWADRSGRLRRDTLLVGTLRPHDPYADAGMLVMEGVTHSTEEMRAMGLKN